MVTTLKRWLAIAERKEPGAGPAATKSAEMGELKKRNPLLEQENEIPRRAAAYLAKDINGCCVVVLFVQGRDCTLQIKSDAGEARCRAQPVPAAKKE
ncbi:hypothetical protein ARTHRO9AX_220218 [Arthrobacter sp. 9AX]|nr:hypothetical protein ARTHRO9AX_220218 [Arthrobacter sp. 9AX]